MIVDDTFSLSLGSTWWSMCQPSMALTSILDGLSSLVSSSAFPLWCGFLDTPYTTSSQLPGLSRRWAFWRLKPKHSSETLCLSYILLLNSIAQLFITPSLLQDIWQLARCFLGFFIYYIYTQGILYNLILYFNQFLSVLFQNKVMLHCYGMFWIWKATTLLAFHRYFCLLLRASK